jgi:hypothetical protein
MSQIIIDTGNVADDGTGSTLRQAFSDVNTMFTEVYTAGPVGSNVQIANNQIVTTVINQDLVIAPSGIGNLQANARVVPGVNDVYDLGSYNKRWNTLYVGTGGIDVTGPVSFANVFVGNLSASGNITGNYFIGNGSQLTGISAGGGGANISNGTSNVTVVSSGGNVTTGIGGTANVLVAATTGLFVTGNVSASGNILGNTLVLGSGSSGNISNVDVITANSIVLSTGTGGNISNINFITGNVVSLSTYIQSAVYANTTVRDSAIASPQPGMMVYVTGTGLQVYGATSWNTVSGTGT